VSVPINRERKELYRTALSPLAPVFHGWLTLLAIGAFAICLFIHIGTFISETGIVDTLPGVSLVLILWTVLLVVVIFSLISPAGWRLTVFINKWRKFPRWAKLFIAILGVHAFANFNITLFGDKSTEGYGNYFLVTGGSHLSSNDIGREITKSQYQHYQAAEIRASSGAALGIFFLSAVFIWNASPKQTLK
jgi:hypothetical protein